MSCKHLNENRIWNQLSNLLVKWLCLDNLEELGVFAAASNDHNPHHHQSISLNPRYALPFTVMAYYGLDTLVQVALRSGPEDPLPGIPMHKVYPRQLWPVGVEVLCAPLLMAILVYAMLLLRRTADTGPPPLLSPQAKIYYDKARNSNTTCKDDSDPNQMSATLQLLSTIGLSRKHVHLPPAESAELDRLRVRSARLLTSISAGIIALTELVYYGTFLTLNWTGSGKDWFWALIMPFGDMYACYAALLLLGQLQVALRALSIRNRCTARRIAWARLQLHMRHNLNSSTLMAALAFRRLQLHQLQVFVQIRALNRFWSPYLTLYFGLYIFELCFFPYSYLFYGRHMTLPVIVFTAIMMTYLVSVLVAITGQCTALVRANIRIHRAGRRFGMAQLVPNQRASERGLRSKGGGRVVGPRVRSALLMDHFESDQRTYGRTGFTLLDGYRINSQMFHVVFTYVSILLMMACSKKMKDLALERRQQSNGHWTIHL